MDPEGVGEFAGDGSRVEGVRGEVDADLMSKLDEYLSWRFISLHMGGGGDLPKRTCRREAR